MKSTLNNGILRNAEELPGEMEPEVNRRELAKKALEEHKLNYLEEGLLQLQISESENSEDEDNNNFQVSHPDKENFMFLTTSKTPYKSREIRTEGSSASSNRFARSPLLDITPNPTKKKKMQPLFNMDFMFTPVRNRFEHSNTASKLR